MSELVGKVLSVETRNDGEPLVADAAAGTFTLSVLDASTFDASGGQVSVNGQRLTYTGVDVDLDTLTLFPALPVAAFADDLVEVYPAATVKVAEVDLGGEGDAVPATVPQALVELLPDGVRDPLNQETVTCAFRGPELVVSDVVGRPLPQGAIDPERVSVGVVGNLVQDPGFKSDTWQPVADPWALVGPDTDFPDINYVQSRNTDSTLVDVDFLLTGMFPVEVGQSVRIAALCRPSASSAAIMVGQPRARVRVEFYKADGTRLSGVDQLAEFLIPDDLDTLGWQPIEGTFAVPEGYVQARAKLQSTYQTAGTIDYSKPSVTVPWNRVASTNYAYGESGWGFGDNESQVESLNVLGDLGASSVSASSFVLDGQDLTGDILNPLPLGIVAYDISSSGVHTGTATTLGTEYKVFEFAMGPSMAGRLYRIVVEGHLVGADTNDTVDMRIRYTTDGSTPSNTSNLMRSERYTFGSTTVSRAFRMEKVFSINTDVDNVRFGIGLIHASGPGSVYIYGTGSDRALVVYVEDVGIYAAAAQAGTLSQKSVASGVTQPDPVVAYTKTFKPSVTETYNGNGSKRLTTTGARSSGMYQGDWKDGHGNQKSIAIFNSTSIMSTLAGATITKVTVTYRVKYGQGGSKFNPSWGTHTYTSVPSTISSGSYTANLVRTTGRNEGSLYTDTLTVAIGNAFKSGAARGILLGPQTGTNRVADPGGVNGYDNGDAPYLTFYYSK